MTRSLNRPRPEPSVKATGLRLLHEPPTEAHLDKPSVARIYDYLLGFAHNFQVDRDATDAAIAVVPGLVHAARANRAFLRRAVQYALAQGVRQFLDLGAGLPAVGAVHTIAHEVDPDARVVYVDIDPIVIAHARATVRGLMTVGVLHADIRDTTFILDHAEVRRLIGFHEPVAILLASVLHFVPDDVTGVVAALCRVMAAGGYIVISHACNSEDVSMTDAIRELYGKTSTPIHPRSRQQIRGLLAGLDLVSPDPRSQEPDDLVPVTRWRRDLDELALPTSASDSSQVAGLLAAVGHAPRLTTAVAVGHSNQGAPPQTHDLCVNRTWAPHASRIRHEANWDRNDDRDTT
ncbi:SAM-dependent methyltransferase [Micromonospora sp. WMMD1082]|uniref:SAM-dependent methyltransferase n=1 Tax=Micromonospora sp. WMMD1082 TaxID=3016104 RepID=UPI00241800C8|nr:SAM-dependent methyltransferase [Micromonospora sp. WMMD1082]MDG4793678.1 SAM-dependent methyltransferase [Micromonospora sp. WMMD1082]